MIGDWAVDFIIEPSTFEHWQNGGKLEYWHLITKVALGDIIKKTKNNVPTRNVEIIIQIKDISPESEMELQERGHRTFQEWVNVI